MPAAIPVIISAFQAAASYAAAATFAITGSAGLASFVANTILGVAGVTTAGLPLASAAASFIQASLLQQLMKAISPKPKNLNGGSQVRFGPNPQAPRPFIFGRTGTAGTPVVATTHGSGKNNNKWLTYIVALSCFGPVQSIEALALNQVNAPITGGMVTGGQYANKVWCTYRNGEWGQVWTPTFGPSTIPEWTPNHRGAGIAHACITYEYDTNVMTGGAPAPVWTVQGSTGIYNASTLSLGYSANPADVYYTLLRGIESPNGNRIGVGLDAAYIDQAKIAAWRAVCVANNWTCGGVWQITAESLGDVLRGILQSGGAEFAISDGKASVDFFASAASAYTIRENDLSDSPIERPTTDRKARVSRIVPRFRSEAEGWELVPAAAVQDSTLDTEDRGRRRTDTMDFPYVNSAQQARQLAAYNLRVRRSPIVELPMKPHGIGIPCGARVTLDLAEYGISSTTGVVIKNETTATEGGILAVRLDPVDLHTWALGQDGSTVSPGSMPRDPASTVQNVDPADWVASPASTSASGTILPIIRVTGTFPNPTLARLDVQIKPNASTEWVDVTSLVAGTPALEIRSLTPNTIYNLRARYVTTGGAASPAWVNLPDVTTGAFVAGAADVGLGGNSVVNSDFRRGLYGFTALGFNTSGLPVVRAFEGFGPTWTPYAVSQILGTPAAGNIFDGFVTGAYGGLADAQIFALRVNEGDRIWASFKLSTFNCVGRCMVAWLDQNGAVLSEAQAGSDSGPTTGSYTVPSSYLRTGGFLSVPANAFYAVAFTRFVANGGANPHGLQIEAQLTRVAAGQTVAPPYVSGPPDPVANRGGTIGTDVRLPDGSVPPRERLDNFFNPIGTNQVINSDFNQGTTGFFPVAATNMTGTGFAVNAGRNLSGWSGIRNVLWTEAAVTSGSLSPGGGGYLYGWGQVGFFGGLANLNRYATRVKAGDRVYVGQRLAAHRCLNAGFEVRWFDKDGNWLSEATNIKDVAVPNAGWGNGDPASATLVEDFYTAPPNAAFVVTAPRITNLYVGVSSAYLFQGDPMVCVVPVDQITPPIYTPGPVDRAADLTLENVPVIEGPSSVSFDVDAAGNPDPTSQLPRTLQFIRKRGGVDVSASTTWETVSPVNVTLSAITGGIVNITALAPGNSVFTVRSTHNGVSIDHVVTVQKNSIATGGGVSSKIFRDDTPTGIASGTYSAVLTGVIDGGATGLAKVELNYLPVSWSGSSSNFQFRLTRAGVTLAETGVFNGIDGAGDIGDFLTEIQALAGFYSVAAGTATWSLEARRTSGSGTINTAIGELIVTQTPT